MDDATTNISKPEQKKLRTDTFDMKMQDWYENLENVAKDKKFVYGEKTHIPPWMKKVEDKIANTSPDMAYKLLIECLVLQMLVKGVGVCYLPKDVVDE